jgi:fatty-acyl-CoA synthase
MHPSLDPKIGFEAQKGLVANAAERPDHTALVCGERRLTFGELSRLVYRTAHALAARGVGAGGRVALMLPNCIEFFTVTNAAATLGALAVPINYRWRRDELAYVLGDAAPDALVIDAAFLAECEPALAAAGRPSRDRVLVRGDAQGPSSSWTSYDDAVAARRTRRRRARSRRAATTSSSTRRARRVARRA